MRPRKSNRIRPRRWPRRQHRPQGAPRRDKQLNIKASDECKRVFAQIAQAQGLSAAALFEDMVADRADVLVRAGLLEG